MTCARADHRDLPTHDPGHLTVVLVELSRGVSAREGVGAPPQARHAAEERQGHAGVAEQEHSLAVRFERHPRHHRVLELERGVKHEPSIAAVEMLHDGVQQRRLQLVETGRGDLHRFLRRGAERLRDGVLLFTEEEIDFGEPICVEAVVDERAEHLGEPVLVDYVQARRQVGSGHPHAREPLVRVLLKDEVASHEFADGAVHGIRADDRIGANILDCGDLPDDPPYPEFREQVGHFRLEQVRFRREVVLVKEGDQGVEKRVVERLLNREIRLGSHAQAMRPQVRLTLVEELELPRFAHRDLADEREEQASRPRANHRGAEH